MPVNNTIKLRRGTDWSSNPVLSQGEPGFDTTNNILKIGDGTTAWNGLNPIGSGLDYLQSHPNISAATSSNNSGSTYIQDILLDSNGHVIGITTASESSTETNDLSSSVTWVNVPDANITESSVIQHSGALRLTESQIVDLQNYLTSFTETNDLSSAVTWANVPDTNITESSVVQHTGALRITESQVVDLQNYLTSHPTIASAASSSDNSGRTYIQDILLDSNGHVIGITTATETVAETNTEYTAGTGLSLASTEFSINPNLINSRTEVTSTDSDYLLIWDATDSQLKKVDAGEFRGGGDIVDDTTPQLGGNLDINSKNVTGAGHIDITGSGHFSSLIRADSFIKDGGTSSQFLKADGSVDSSTYLTSFTETNDLSAAVVWANVPDANITESSVVQHTGAFRIKESQIVDLQSYLTSETFTSVVQDTTPQLGGNLDLNSKDLIGAGDIDTSGNIYVSGDFRTAHTSTAHYLSISDAGGVKKIASPNSDMRLVGGGSQDTRANIQATNANGIKIEGDSTTATDITINTRHVDANIIVPTGNLGIGTTDPGVYKFRVKGGHSSFEDGNVQFNGGNVTVNQAGGNYDFRVEGDSNAYLLFTDASTDRVGVGTDNPLTTLHVSGTTSEGTILSQTALDTSWAGLLIRNQDNANVASFQYGNSGVTHTPSLDNILVIGSRQSGVPVKFYQGAESNGAFKENNERIIFDTSGNTILTAATGQHVHISGVNLGIGTTEPARKLHVVGDIEISGTIYQSGTIFQGGGGGGGSTLTEEQVEDFVGGMVTGNTETGITVTYQDADGTLDFVVASQTDENFTTADHSKLDGIEAGADVTDTTNVTSAGALMDSEVTNLAQVKAFDSSDYATAAQGTKADSAQQPPSEGAFVDGDKTKLDGIEASADVTDTANVTSAGALMDSELTDLAGVKGVTISTLQVKPSEGAFADGDKTKLDTIEASADVTDTTNVTAAGALMDSEVTNLSQVKAFDSSDYATAAQGTKADSAQQPPSEGAFANGDKTKLDGIEASADITDTANVTAAGALMDSELTDLAGVKGVTISTLQSKPSEGAFANGDKTKLDGIEANATADQTDEEIQDIVGAMLTSNTETGITVTYQDADGTIDFVVASQTDENFTTADHSKLDGIEAAADVTDTANVTSAGALMDSELTDLAGVKGVTISTLQVKPSEGAFADGDKTKLDAIEASADVTDAANVDAAGAVMNSDTSTASMSFVVDEDNMSSDSNTKIPTQQSVKAYIDSAGFLTAHPNISAASSSDNSGNTFIQDITLDSNGHITALAVATATDGGGGGGISNVVEDTTPQLGGNLDLNSKDITGTGDIDVTGSGHFSSLVRADSFVKDGGTSSEFLKADGSVDTSTYLTAHPNISAAGSVNNSANQFIQDITVDSNGHITSMASTTVTQLTQEEVEDFVGGMLTGNTETGITVTYQDADGTIDFVVASQTDENFTTADHSKLDGIEASADVTDTANVTSAGALMDSEVTNLAQVKAFDSSDYATAAQGTKADSAQQPPSEGAFANGDKTKLDGIEASATADQTDEEIQDIVGAMLSSNTETGITVTYQDADGTIDFVVASQTDENFTTADHSKLDGIEASADVTDTANVTSAGALMDSELTDLAGVKGVTISTLQVKPSEGAFADGDKTKLDGIEASADVTDATNVNTAGAVMNSDSTTADMSFVIDEDNMASDSATKVPTQQSVKAYVDANAGGATLTEEQVEDFVGGMVTGNTETGITVTYQDSDGTLDFVVASQTDENFTTADHSKLDGIEASADVTDTANVTSAGALMDSELTDLAGVKGVTISTLQVKPSEGAFANGDKTKLDGIEASATADQTDEEIQDIVGAMVSSNTETGITVTYQDADGTLDFVVDHDAASNFVANEHIDHTSVTLTAGDGLTGGGDISANRTFAVSVDDSTIEINSDALRIKDAAITPAKIGVGTFVFNEAGANYDFRVEGDTDANLLFLDASKDSVLIGNSTDGSVNSKLHVYEVANTNTTNSRTVNILGRGYSTTDGSYYHIANNSRAEKYLSASTTDGGYCIGVNAAPIIYSPDGTNVLAEVTAFRANPSINTAASNVTVTNAYDIKTVPYFQGTNNTVTNHYGLYLGDAGAGGTTPTNEYGVYQVNTAATNYFGGTLDVRGAAVFNEGGAAVDFRVEGDTDANLLFVDGSADRVGIGTNAPAYLLDVDGAIGADSITVGESNKYLTMGRVAGGTFGVARIHEILGTFEVMVGANTAAVEITNHSVGSPVVTINPAGIDMDFIVEGDTDTDLLFCDAGNDIVQIGKLNINGAFTLPTSDGSANQILKTDGNGTVSWAADGGGGGGGGSMTTVKANGSQVGGADIVTLDFASNFAVTETPDTEVNIDLSSSIATQGITATTGLIVGVSGLHHQSGTIVHSTEAAWGEFPGNAQHSTSLLTGKTTHGNSYVNLTMNNGMYPGVRLPSNKTFFADISIVGRRTNSTTNANTQHHAAYQLKQLIVNDAFGSDLLGSLSKTVISEGNSSWDVGVSLYDNPGGSGQTDYLQVAVKGAASSNVNWVAKVDLLEVGGLNETSAYREANILTNMSPEIIP